MSDKNSVHPGAAETPVSALLGAECGAVEVFRRAIVSRLAGGAAKALERSNDRKTPQGRRTTEAHVFYAFKAAIEMVEAMSADGVLGRQDRQLRDEPEQGGVS